MEEGTNMKSNNSHFKEAKYLGKLCHILSVFICYKTNALVSNLPRAKIPGSARRMMGDCIGKHEAVSPDFAKFPGPRGQLQGSRLLAQGGKAPKQKYSSKEPLRLLK